MRYLIFFIYWIYSGVLVKLNPFEDEPDLIALNPSSTLYIMALVDDFTLWVSL